MGVVKKLWTDAKQVVGGTGRTLADLPKNFVRLVKELGLSPLDAARELLEGNPKQSVRQLLDPFEELLRTAGLLDEYKILSRWSLKHPLKAAVMLTVVGQYLSMTLPAVGGGKFAAAAAGKAATQQALFGGWLLHGWVTDVEEGKDPVGGLLERLAMTASVLGSAKAVEPEAEKIASVVQGDEGKGGATLIEKLGDDLGGSSNPIAAQFEERPAVVAREVAAGAGDKLASWAQDGAEERLKKAAKRVGSKGPDADRKGVGKAVEATGPDKSDRRADYSRQPPRRRDRGDYWEDRRDMTRQRKSTKRTLYL